MYRLLRPLLFTADPETVHEATLRLLQTAGATPVIRTLLAARYRVDDPRLAVERFGLQFPNPVGLAAGMDKDGRALPAWPALGFGFCEVGSVTAREQPGNPRPRLIRLAADEAIINRMGFNNRGAAALAAQLAAERKRLLALRTGANEMQPSGSDERLGLAWRRSPIFANVGKSRAAPLADAAADYRESLELVWPEADGVVINVSSPNTPGLRTLQEPAALTPLLAVCDDLQSRRQLPVLLKLSPELSHEQLEAIVDLAGDHAVAGLVAVNTTESRAGLQRQSSEAGGLSGRPLAHRSLAVLRFLAARTELPLVSVGGIFDHHDLIRRLRAGAALVELYTGFVYGGPGTVRSLLNGLLGHLEQEGIRDIDSLIGLDR